MIGWSSKTPYFPLGLSVSVWYYNNSCFLKCFCLEMHVNNVFFLNINFDISALKQFKKYI